jgi:Rne/Rng family ribonuclease
MSKEICISTTPHETRLAILENDELTEIYYERENEYTLAGSIYKGKVTRVLPGMQSAFVDVGLERDAFLYVTDFLEEQDGGAEFDRVGGGQQQQQQPRREGGRDRDSVRGGRQPQEAAPPAAAPVSEQEESEDGDSPSGTKRWRGRRGRRRGSVRSRESQPQDETIVLESPKAPFLEVGESVADEPEDIPEHGAPGGTRGVAAASTKILLPGESLARYGGAPSAEPVKAATAQAAPAKVNYTAPKPSTLIETPLAWDGGSLLPGESRARHRGAAPAAEPQAYVAEPSTAQTLREEAEAEAREIVDTALEAVPVTDFEVMAQDADLPVVSEPVVSEPVAEAPVEADSPAVVAETVHAVEVAEPVHEVPEAPEAVAEVSEPEAKHEIVHELVEEEQEFEPEEASASHRIDPVAPSEFRVSTPFEEEPQVAVHESEHEETIAATVEEHEQDAQAADDVEAVDQVFGFAPGAGVLEEEVIDEDEYDFEPIHAHADEQDEELEEETLENSGLEIGDAVRDAHLEQRLSVERGSLGEEAEETDDYALGEAGFDGNGDEDDSEEDEFASEETEEPNGEVVVADGASPRREGDRRGGRRRGGDRGGRPGHLGRKRHGGGGRRPSAQTMDLPIISELLKQGQEILVQIAKEPIAKKGARITSHIALPGRFLVFMPTVNHVGVSRKISSDDERQRLKRILISEKGEASGGFIVRTAADGASEDELRADLRFLISLWNDIKQREEGSKSPALIYHDLNLVERVLRDQVSDNFSTIWVDSEVEYERTVRFLNRFQPSLVRRVKLYTKETPLFEHFGIQDEISKALKSKVWLKSGGSIVINQTEALVAIDINTGKYVGKTARLEDTIVKTNLDAIPEIVRQIRLRDLGGIIVIDFIDMDERKNRNKVLQALEEALKADRAPSKVLQFNDFGLVAITRKRVKQSLERTLSTPCPVCAATGMVKSPVTVANEIYVELRKMQRHLDRGDVMLRVNPEVVKTLKASNARWLSEMEEMVGKTIIVKSDPALHPEQFDIH